MNVDNANRWLTLVANFAVIAGIIATGHPDSTRLSEDTYVSYAMLHLSMMQMAQSTHYLYLSGAIDGESWRAEISRAAGILTAPGVRQWWDAGGKTQLTPTFVEFIESVDTNITWWDWDNERGVYGVVPGELESH